MHASECGWILSGIGAGRSGRQSVQLSGLLLAQGAPGGRLPAQARPGQEDETRQETRKTGHVGNEELRIYGQLLRNSSVRVLLFSSCYSSSKRGLPADDRIKPSNYSLDDVGMFQMPSRRFFAIFRRQSAQVQQAVRLLHGSKSHRVQDAGLFRLRPWESAFIEPF